MKIYIYKLVDPINNIIGYIGETTNPDARENAHQSDAKLPDKYFPLLKYPVTKNADNWKRWLGYMGIKPIMVVIDTIEGTKFDARRLEGKYIAAFTKKGIKLTNDYRPADKLPCPYDKLWRAVWESYQKLHPPKRTEEERFPQLLTIEKQFEQRRKIIRAIENKMYSLRTAASLPIYELIRAQDVENQRIAEEKVNNLFASLRAQQKTIALRPTREDKKAG